MTPAWARDRFPALANSQYRLLFLGNSLSMLAFGMMQVVQGAVAFGLTGKNSAVGLVSLGMGISMLTLGLVGGALSDRLPKRRILLVTQTAIGAVFGCVGILIVTDVITIWLLAGSTLVMGAMFALMGPTRQAWVGDLLEGPALSNGVALQQLMMNATRIVGPLLAGAMIATSAIGEGGAYLAMTGTFLVVVLLLFRMEPAMPRPKENPTSVFADMSAGASYIWRTPELRLLIFAFVGIVLSGFSYQTIMPGLLENELGQSTSQLGTMYGVTAIGGIVATLILAARPRQGDASLLMFCFGIALAASLLLLAVAPNFGLALLVATLVGAASSGFQLLNNVTLMERTDPVYYGRVMSLTMMAFGVNSIVAYPIGRLADGAGERPTLMVLACLCFGVVTVGLLMLRVVSRGKTRQVLPPPREPAPDTELVA